jgi:cell division protein FtsQ
MRLIDAEGMVLPAADLAGFSGLPLLVGPAADRAAAQLLKLVASQPALAREMEAAMWIGQRRWDLRMKSGETISLPEGPAAQAALMRFADIHRGTPLLGRGFVRFDLRIPDKMVVRVSGEAGGVARPNKAKPQVAPQPVPQAAQPAVRPQQALAAQVVARAAGQTGEVII